MHPKKEVFTPAISTSINQVAVPARHAPHVLVSTLHDQFYASIKKKINRGHDQLQNDQIYHRTGLSKRRRRKRIGDYVIGLHVIATADIALIHQENKRCFN